MSCDAELGTAAERWFDASGTIANLVAGGLSLGALDLAPPSNGANRYALWLFAASELFAGGGYLMADAIFQFGDWAAFNATFEHAGLLRAGELAAGAGIYVGTFFLARDRLEPLLGDELGRRGRAAVLGLVPYAVSGVLLPAAAAVGRRPGAILSAALASLGGLSGLAWMWAYVDPTGVPSSLRVERSWPWVGVGALSLAGIAVLAYGVEL